jgi:hypothetical protein
MLASIRALKLKRYDFSEQKAYQILYNFPKTMADSTVFNKANL